MSAIYPTRILAGRLFRLLSICPSLDSDQPLECYCRTYEFVTAPSYEALSYVWGAHDPSTDSQIYCNGEATAVRLALARALRRLRLPQFPRIVWIDAICINQKDIEEKSYQVPLMGSIYSLAARVVIWLGPGDPLQVNEAAQYVRFVANACRQHNNDPEMDSRSTERYENLDSSANPFTSIVCEGLKQLYGRPWFSRIWCVQEIRRAQDAVVLWDDQEIPWSDVGRTASWILAVGQDDNGDAMPNLLSEVAAEQADLMYNGESQQAPLLEILRSHREWESTDPKDMVYGLLSLVAPESEAEALKPDYNKTVGDVFADTVLVIIELYSRLTGLAYVSHPEEYDGQDGYRSWAPRWDIPEVAEVIGITENAWPWRADAGHNTEILTENIKPGQLCLVGVLYDTVTTVLEIMSVKNLRKPGNYNNDGVHPFCRAFENHERQQPSIETSEKDYMNWWVAFARTLSAGSIGNRPVLSTDQKAQRVLLKAFGDLMIALEPQYSDDAHTSAVIDSTASSYKSDAYFYCNDRRFFWTENGTFGLGPQCMRTGDIVVVLYGGYTPYVLRPKGDTYLFIGQAYVDNIMQGQLVEEVHAGRLQKQEFCLI
jgi:hypothetical protein